MEISKAALLGYLGRDLDNATLEDRIAMLGTDVERISGSTISVECFPDRPDMLSEEGLARALKGFLGIETGLAKYSVNKSSYAAKIDKSVANVRPYAVAAVVKGVGLDGERLIALMQLQEKLHTTHCHRRKSAAIGVHNLDPIKWPITYTTVGKGFRFVPLEFTREMAMGDVLTKHPKGIEYAHLVQGKRYPVWLDAGNNVIAFPPIINGAMTALKPGVKDYFIDVTGDNRRVVDQALNIVVTAMADMGGEVYGVKVGTQVTPDLSPREAGLDIGYVNKLLGLSLSQKQAADCLGRMRYGMKGKRVLVPCYRTDILHPMDLVEDIAIAYGYENFEPVIPNVSTVGEESRAAVYERKLAEVLSGIGFLGCNTYHLSSKETLLHKMALPDKKLVVTTNAVNANYGTLRNALLPGLLNILSENRHYEYPQKLFDIGSVISLEKREIHESLSLAAAVTHAGADFTAAKSVLDALFSAIGEEFRLKQVSSPSFMPGRVGAIMHKGKAIGLIGEVHPQVLNNFDLEQPVAGFEICFESLL